ncbi:MAG: ATP-binding cassette domain-containing protein [Burkholderiaceae bacterium]
MLELHGLRALNLKPVDLSVAAGQCLAIMGDSGSGKSLLLRAIADLDPHDGDAAVDGRWCRSMPATEWRRMVSYVPAESGWWAERVREHFAADADLPSMLASLRLKAALAESAVTQLSTGERQRLALLRALRPGVRVMLLDEPTSGLDEGSTAAVEAWLGKVLARGLCVLLVTHSAAQAARMAVRRVLLADGALWEAPP